MGLYYDQISSASPVAVLQPQQHVSKSYGMRTDGQTIASIWPSQAQARTHSSTAGRKRSRDEAADNLEDENYFPLAAASIQESEDEWEYGEGMTLIRPNGFIIDASSQTGTWAEEKAALSHPPTPVSQQSPTLHDRPNLRSHKSQRLDLTAIPVIDEEIGSANSTLVASSPPKMATTGAEDPTVDAFTIHLGIGWSRISEDGHIQAAARGWAKFIENHYAVSSAKIRLQSKGLASYLVEANEGWFLFGEDLKEGRLVSTSLEKTFENLRTSPPRFDGIEILTAVAETSRVDVETRQEIAIGEPGPSNLAPEATMSGTSSTHVQAEKSAMNSLGELQSSVVQDLEVEMDMS